MPSWPGWLPGLGLGQGTCTFLSPLQLQAGPASHNQVSVEPGRKVSNFRDIIQMLARKSRKTGGSALWPWHLPRPAAPEGRGDEAGSGRGPPPPQPSRTCPPGMLPEPGPLECSWSSLPPDLHPSCSFSLNRPQPDCPARSSPLLEGAFPADTIPSSGTSQRFTCTCLCGCCLEVSEGAGRLSRGLQALPLPRSSRQLLGI